MLLLICVLLMMIIPVLARVPVWRRPYFLGLSVLGGMMASFGLMLMLSGVVSGMVGMAGIGSGFADTAIKLIFLGGALFWGGLLGACFYREKTRA